MFVRFAGVAQLVLARRLFFQAGQAFAARQLVEHLLLIPKRHVASLSDCDDSHADMLGKLLRLAPKLAAEFGCAVSYDADGVPSGGFKTMINSGPNGGQEVYHLHLHVYGGPRPWRGQH